MANAETRHENFPMSRHELSRRVGRAIEAVSSVVDEVPEVKGSGFTSRLLKREETKDDTKDQTAVEVHRRKGLLGGKVVYEIYRDGYRAGSRMQSSGTLAAGKEHADVIINRYEVNRKGKRLPAGEIKLHTTRRQREGGWEYDFGKCVVTTPTGEQHQDTMEAFRALPEVLLDLSPHKMKRIIKKRS